MPAIANLKVVVIRPPTNHPEIISLQKDAAHQSRDVPSINRTLGARHASLPREASSGAYRTRILGPANLQRPCTASAPRRGFGTPAKPLYRIPLRLRSLLGSLRIAEQSLPTSLRRKTLLIIALTTVGLVGSLFLISRALLNRGFDKLEEEYARQSVSRASTAIA